MTPYTRTALHAATILRTAMSEAETTLPSAVTRQHWIAGHHSPSAWRSVEAHYQGQVPQDLEILATLTDLALMSEALACLTSVTTEKQEGPLNLHLAKVRRQEIQAERTGPPLVPRPIIKPSTKRLPPLNYEDLPQ